MSLFQAAQPKKVKQAARALTQDELIAEALETEEINLASLDVFLTEEEERRARNANLKRDVVEGPLLRFVSRGEKVRVPMIVEVEISTPPTGYGNYKRPYVPGPLLSLPRPPNVPGSTPYYSAFGNNSYGRPALPSSAGASGSSKDTSVTRPTPSSSPYYYPLPNPPSRTGNTAPANTLSLNSGVNSGKLVTQAKNYVILETPGASPAKDYQYLFGNHVDWGSLKVLPKNHSSGTSILESSQTIYSSHRLDSAQANTLPDHWPSSALSPSGIRDPLCKSDGVPDNRSVTETPVCLE